MNHNFEIQKCKRYLGVLLSLIQERRDYLERWNYPEHIILEDEIFNDLYQIADKITYRLESLEQHPGWTIVYIYHFLSYRWKLNGKLRRRFDSIFQAGKLSTATNASYCRTVTIHSLDNQTE